MESPVFLRQLKQVLILRFGEIRPFRESAQGENSKKVLLRLKNYQCSARPKQCAHPFGMPGPRGYLLVPYGRQEGLLIANKKVSDCEQEGKSQVPSPPRTRFHFRRIFFLAHKATLSTLLQSQVWTLVDGQVLIFCFFFYIFYHRQQSAKIFLFFRPTHL